MTKNQTLVKPVAAIGEEIGFELGKQMVSDHDVANPMAEIQFYELGRNILDQILAQPGCEGIRFYYGYNEQGEKTLVYVGLDKKGKPMFQYTCVNNDGSLSANKGIVADRIKTGGGNHPPTPAADDWTWTVD